MDAKKAAAGNESGPLFVSVYRRNPHGQRRNAESRIADLDEVHRLEQAVFPAELELVSIAEQQCPLQKKLRHNRADIDGIDNRPRLQRTLAAHAVKVARRLIEGLDHRRIVMDPSRHSNWLELSAS